MLLQNENEISAFKTYTRFRLCKKSVISIINSITYKIYKYLINLASMMVKMSSVSESILVSKVRIVGLCIAGR